MANDRRPLPYKVVDAVNLAVLKKYRQVAFVATANIKALLKAPSGVSDEEQVLRRLVKAVERGEMVFEQGEKVKVLVGEDWQDAEVTNASGTLMVKRADGCIRTISDLKKVMKMEQPDPKDGFYLEKFGVRIPIWTKSYEIEKSLQPITARMNITSLRVNKATWEKNLQKVSQDYAELEAKCREISGNPKFRPNASRDCIAEFKDKRGLPLGKTGASGVPSVDKDVLQSLSNMGDNLAPVVMQAREVLSHLSQLEKWAPYAEAGSVQCNWDQFGQPHGRYTSDNPNLQNRVTEIRETVEAKEGYSLISADWGMAEYVTWASLSKDAYLSSIFESGRDLHAEMGQDLNHLNPSRNLGSDSPRKFGKTTNFAILYRMQPWTLAKSLGVALPDAEAVLEAYNQKAPSASRYSEEILEKAARAGFVETAFGRRLYCRDLATLKGGALHQLQKTVWHHHNAGTAAEMLKLKMVLVEKAVREAGVSEEDAHIALNMHDEIILEVRDSEVEKVSGIVLEEMRKRVEGFLPFKVDLRVGMNWLQISK